MGKENKTSDKPKNGNDFIADVSSSYNGKESRPLRFGELELILIRYKIMLEEEPDRYTVAEFIQQEDFRRSLLN